MKTLIKSSRILALAACCAVTASAQIDRTKQPAADPAPKALFPSYEQFTLKNGLQVFLVRDSRPLVTFRMLVRGGNSGDGDIPGLADAAAEMMTRGTTKRTADQFADEIDFIGGTITASTQDEGITVLARGLKEYTPQILDLYADAILHPSYPADELAKYQQEQLTGLQSSKSNVEWLATSAINKVLFGETPYGRTVNEAAVSKWTTDNIRNYYKTYFVPGNAMLAVIGNFTADELKSTLEGAFGSWQQGKVPSLPRPTFPARNGHRIVLVDRPSSVQSAIRVLSDGPVFTDPERPKATILNSILGGNNGRLYKNLRETHGYTYGAYSGFDANQYAGRFMATADVRNAVTDSALAEMINEIENIRKGSSDAELLSTVQSAEGNFLLSVSDPSITAQRILFINQYGLPKDYYQNLVGTYRATSQKDLMELAKRYLKTDNLAIVVVGKASEIKPKLEKFGKVEVWDAKNM